MAMNCSNFIFWPMASTPLSHRAFVFENNVGA